MPLVYDDTPAGKLVYDEAPRTPSGWELAKSIGGTVGQTIVDAGTAAGHAATFGLDVRRDALSGWLAGDYPSYSAGVEAEQAKLEKQRERSPYASIAGDVGGAALIPGMGGAGLAARLGTGLGRWGQAGARAAGYGLEGAATGAAQGAGTTYSGKPVDYITNAATGGAVGGVLGAGMGSIFGPRGGMQSTAKVPTTAEQYADKTARYTALENSPALYEPNALARAATPTEDVLRAQRYHQNDSPRTFRAVDEMRAPPTTEHLGIGAPVSPGDIEYIRKGLKRTEQGIVDRDASGYVKRALDNFVLNPPPGAVIPGTERAAAEASALAQSARDAHGAFRRGQLFDSLIENATTSAAGAASGLNLQNRLRQAAGGALRMNDKGQSALSKAHYSPEEIARVTEFARVPRGDATLRYVDRIMGGGGGLGLTAAAVAGGAGGGAYFEDPKWAGTVAIPAAGFALRTLGNRRALRNMNELRDMVHQRSPLYQERVATAPMVPPPGGGIPATLRDAMAIEVLRQQGDFPPGDEDTSGIPRIRVTPREE